MESKATPMVSCNELIEVRLHNHGENVTTDMIWLK